jgi:diacylglycerol kinase (ATP)
MRVAVIINPISGAAGRRDTPEIRRRTAERVLGGLGVTPDIHVTAHAGHASILARAAIESGAAVVCAWGGDGTLNEVASTLTFGRVPLVLVPAGSGNGLARELGVPRDPERALAVAVHGSDRVLDAGTIDGRFFFNMAGVGFDALIAQRFAVAQGPRGFGPYLAIAARQLWTYHAASYEIEIDGQCTRERAMMIVLANSRQYGNGAIIAPGAKPDDGALDLIVVRAQSIVGAMCRVPRLFNGTLDTCRAVSMRRFEALTITGPGPLAYHVDGEPVDGPARLDVRVRPGALQVRC